jgi:hypothetical protein
MRYEQINKREQCTSDLSMLNQGLVILQYQRNGHQKQSQSRVYNGRSKLKQGSESKWD